MSAVLKLDAKDFFIARIRALQFRHTKAHVSLTNWGHWSADKRGIFPAMRPPALWNQFKRSEVEEWGEEQPPAISIVKEIAKPEPRETSSYDERTALVLDERIHGYGGLGVEHRRALRVAYVTREIPEDQFPRACGCSEDGFYERLEAGLIFTGRFA